jgi:hypothetical protein
MILHEREGEKRGRDNGERERGVALADQSTRRVTIM